MRVVRWALVILAALGIALICVIGLNFLIAFGPRGDSWRTDKGVQ